MTATSDYDLGMLTLCAHGVWKHARWLDRVRAALFGRHHVYEHLGMRLRVSFWHEQPYLISIRQVRP